MHCKSSHQPRNKKKTTNDQVLTRHQLPQSTMERSSPATLLGSSRLGCCVPRSGAYQQLHWRWLHRRYLRHLPPPYIPEHGREPEEGWRNQIWRDGARSGKGWELWIRPVQEAAEDAMRQQRKGVDTEREGLHVRMRTSEVQSICFFFTDAGQSGHVRSLPRPVEYTTIPLQYSTTLLD